MPHTQDQGEDSEMNEDFTIYEDMNYNPRSKGALTKPKMDRQPPKNLMKKHERL